jgi:cyclic nucleotide gated channel
MRSLSKNTEDWRMWQTEMEDWMKDHQIPDELRYRISQFFKYKWIATQGVEEDSILRQLPADLHRDIKRYLCLDLVERVRESCSFKYLLQSQASHVLILTIHV